MFLKQRLNSHAYRQADLELIYLKNVIGYADLHL